MVSPWLAISGGHGHGHGHGHGCCVFLTTNPTFNNTHTNTILVPNHSSLVSTTSSCVNIHRLTISRRKDDAFKGNVGSHSHHNKPQDQEEDEQLEVLTSIRSNYNNIVIVDSPRSTFLLLDSTNSVHSILHKQGQKWTDSYWDEFATLPAIVPKGPIAMLGLGGGTAARLMLDLCPSLELHGWEIDQILIDKARDYLGLSDLEKPTKDGGVLHVHIGDALSTSENDVGKYAGMVVDLFSDGKVLAQLEEAATWLELKNRLMPNGRVMVNCGGIDGNPIDGTWHQNSVIKALYHAFQGQISWKRTPKEHGENYMALSGPLPDLTLWSAGVSGHLSEGVMQWKSCGS